ncbi:MAG: GYD domain-containing protein [Planctomycetes bacterium]|nr:GYD domain-containing protein [Planctomycetota bacterium]
MATFITTIKFTQQGIKGIDETTKRAAALKAAGRKIGAKITDIYWTMGDHDGVLIFEAPDDETATTLLLHLGASGNVHTTTVRAFTAAEMDKILTKVHVG